MASIENKELYKSQSEHLLRSLLSSSEQFDKAVLTLSSAGLGLSLTFLRFVVPFADAQCKSLLSWSWTLFILAIISTVLSFLTSQYAVTQQLARAERAYIHEDETALEESNPLGFATAVLNCFSAATFVFALIFTVVFVRANL